MITSPANPSLKAFQAMFADIAYQPFSHETSPYDALAMQSNSPLTEAFYQLPSDRLKQYQWMVFANHQEALEAIYPYTFQLLNEEWDEVVCQYLQAHPPHSYQLFDVAKAFPFFLATQEKWMNAFPFLEDLATYEQLEAHLLKEVSPITIAPSPTLRPPTSADDLAITSPVLALVAAPFFSFYPIDAIVEALKHCTEAETALPVHWPIASGPLVLWVYRDAEFRCRFIKISGVMQAFLSLALKSKNKGDSYRFLLEAACATYGMELTPAIEAGFQSFLCGQLHSLGIVLGSVKI